MGQSLIRCNIRAQERMAKYYNLRYLKQPALKPGDMVMVSMKNMASRRLDWLLHLMRLCPI